MRKATKANVSGDRCCRKCGTPVGLSWHLPTSCKECGASFAARPQWLVTIAFLVATTLAVGVMALLRQVTDATALLACVGLLVGFIGFNAAELVMFRAGLLRLTNVNADDPLDAVELQADDALAQAEREARAKGYAGTDKRTRAAQARQLRQSIELARSLKTGEEVQDATAETAVRKDGAPRPRCRFKRLAGDDERAVRAMSSLATRIVREHFDPIVGPEQNDYMIARFQSPEAIAAQIEEGYEYYFVFPPRESQSDDGQRRKVRPNGFLAVCAQTDGSLYLSKFYLLKEERGKGYAHSMMGLVLQRARKLGCDRVTLNVNRNNYQAILAYEHLGFERTGARRTDIGGGFEMDDYVYELSL